MICLFVNLLYFMKAMILFQAALLVGGMDRAVDICDRDGRLHWAEYDSI